MAKSIEMIKTTPIAMEISEEIALLGIILS